MYKEYDLETAGVHVVRVVLRELEKEQRVADADEPAAGELPPRVRVGGHVQQETRCEHHADRGEEERDCIPAEASQRVHLVSMAWGWPAVNWAATRKSWAMHPRRRAGPGAGCRV